MFMMESGTQCEGHSTKLENIVARIKQENTTNEYETEPGLGGYSFVPDAEGNADRWRKETVPHGGEWSKIDARAYCETHVAHSETALKDYEYFHNVSGASSPCYEPVDDADGETGDDVLVMQGYYNSTLHSAQNIHVSLQVENGEDGAEGTEPSSINRTSISVDGSHKIVQSASEENPAKFDSSVDCFTASEADENYRSQQNSQSIICGSTDTTSISNEESGSKNSDHGIVIYNHSDDYEDMNHDEENSNIKTSLSEGDCQIQNSHDEVSDCFNEAKTHENVNTESSMMADDAVQGNYSCLISQLQCGPNPVSCKSQSSLCDQDVDPYEIPEEDQVSESTCNKNDSCTSQDSRTASEKVICCDVEGCDKTYKGHTALKRHKLKVHTKEKDRPYQCSFGCGKHFIDRYVLEEHEAIHKGEAHYPCEDCKKVFSTRTLLKQHQRIHEVTEKPMVCTIDDCGKIYHNTNRFREHQRNCHREKKFSCPHKDCSFKSHKQCMVKYHIKNVHRIKKPRSYPCHSEGCGKVYNDRTGLRRHILALHTDEKDWPCVCSQCGKRFIDQYKLKFHEESHKEEDNYCCTKCGKLFKSKCGLTQHKRIHKTLEEPIVCTVDNCGKTFDTYVRFKNHQANSHTEKKNVCPYENCTFKARKKCFLTYHIMNVHEKLLKFINYQWNSNGQIQCEKCDLAFNRPGVYRVHVWSFHRNEVQWWTKGTDPNQVVKRIRRKKPTSKKQTKVSKANTVKTSSKRKGLGDESSTNNTDNTKKNKRKRHPVNRIVHKEEKKAESCDWTDEESDKETNTQKDKIKKAALMSLSSMPDVNMREMMENYMYFGPSTISANMASLWKNEQTDLQGKSNSSAPTTESNLSQKDNSSEKKSESETADGSDGKLKEPDDKESDKTQVQAQDVQLAPEDCTDGIGLVRLLTATGKHRCLYPNCRSVFNDKASLETHQRTHSTQVKCHFDGCNKGFFSELRLTHHIQKVHCSGPIPLIQCPKCGACLNARYKFAYNKHVKKCAGPGSHKCEHEGCMKQFTTRSALHNHMKIHAPKTLEEVKKHKCHYENCGKRFYSKKDLHYHINVHTGARPYNCPHEGCTKRFKQRPHLYEHVRLVHEKRRETVQLPCPYCNKIFVWKSNYQRHLKRIHKL